jgi:hypothetical protein
VHQQCLTLIIQAVDPNLLVSKKFRKLAGVNIWEYSDEAILTGWTKQITERKKAWKALHFVMRVLKNGNRNTERSAYTSLVRRILKYGSACWDPCREGQINALERVQKKGAQFTNHTKDSDWEIWLSVGR